MPGSRQRLGPSTIRSFSGVLNFGFLEISPDEKPAIQELYAKLAQDPARNDLIFDDILSALEAGRSPVVITERKDHLDILAGRLSKFAKNVIVLRGGMSARRSRAASEALGAIPDGEERVLVATGRYLGEGFDDARLDTLFLTMPISWRGTLCPICRPTAPSARGEARRGHLRLRR